MKTSEKLEQAFHEFRPHINGHNTAMDLFFQALREVKEQESKAENLPISGVTLRQMLDRVWQLHRDIISLLAENTGGVSTSIDESGVSHGVSDRNASRSSSDELSEEVVGGTLALRTQDENLVICPNSVAHGHMKKTVSGSYWCVNCQRYYQM